MKNILAKSDGTTLIQHSNDVSRVAVLILNTLGDLDPILLDVVKIAGLLHDIGKCTGQFQKVLKNNTDDESKSKIKYLHNEIGWAFLSKYLKLKPQINSLVLDAVYWHHGIINKMGKDTNSTILNKITQSDIQLMLDYLTITVGVDNINETTLIKDTPNYYHKGTWANDADGGIKELSGNQLLVRTILISADRFVSRNNIINLSDEEILRLFESDKLRLTNLDVSNHKYFGNDRFNLQQSIIIDFGKTTIVKAPAGFGKTILGILWMISRGKKIFWVCPRNVIAESVYHTINEELKSFGFDISVELFLGGEVVSSTHNSNGFESDIIITNIDNYLAPSVDNSHSEKLYQILNFDVVFDEWDELVCDSALFACFVNIMNVRNNITNGNSLLLSATPVPISYLWDSPRHSTVVLPNKQSHYPAAHKTPFKLNIVDNFSGVKPNNNTLTIVNSIAKSQLTKHKDSILIHSDYIDSDRKRIFKEIFDIYGKTDNRIVGTKNVVSTLVIQASLDISFLHVYESVLSHQTTFQRLGRCNRHNDYSIQPTFNICNLSGYEARGEDNVRDIFFSKNLSGLWFEYISKYDGKSLTLDEAYLIYNDFTDKNLKILEGFVGQKHHNSQNRLAEIYPVKLFNKKLDNDVKTAGSNKLRASKNDIFVIAKVYNSDTEYCDPFSVQIYNRIDEQFDESNQGIKISDFISSMKTLRNQNDDRFDYNKLINLGVKRLTIDEIREAAKKSNTPYIRYDAVYHPVYGIITKNNLQKIASY